MTVNVISQMDELRRSMEGLEAQRAILGDKVVNPALSALRQQLAALEEQAAAQASPAEERRLLTILFTDMVGSTSMAEKLDPEEWRHLLSMLHETLGKAIVAHRGEVAQYLGDGLLAFFGAKEAGEDDPENAIRAALDAQAAVAELPVAQKVQIRAGIHTGLVVVGELGEAAHKEFTASGDAMNLAARLQSAAPPGGVLISQDTYRYVRGVFDLTPRPPLTVKGKSEPVQTYLVRQAKPRPFRTAARGVAGVEARTIGREAELQALQAAYLRAYEGHGVVWAQLISGPGLGKSRLVSELDDWMDLREETYRLLRARAFPDDVHQPFALVRRLWFDRFQIADDTPLDQAEAKWVERFGEFCGSPDCEEAAQALGLLVGLPFENSAHIKGMRDDPMQVKGRALVVSREVIAAVRKEMPLVVLLEDLQWADAASWEYVIETCLSEPPQDQPNGMFILGTARPEWQPPHALAGLLGPGAEADQRRKVWGTVLSLNPLRDESVRELARDLFQRAADVPPQMLDLVVERSEGVPYYAEEMVNWFMDHGILDTRTEPWRFLPEKLKEQPLPATLQHLLLTRLSALSSTERAALQRGAIFGRRFWTGGLEALGVSDGEETLGHLQPRGFVQAQPESAFEGDTEWAFHQSLLQEVTYESVLKRERAALHKVAAEWLEHQAQEAGRLDEFSGLLGDHCERAGELSTAANWYASAGKRAMRQGAPREAVRFFTQALELLPPVDKERRWSVLLGREQAHGELGDAVPWRADVDALVDLARAFGDDDHLAEALSRRAILLLRTGDEPHIDQGGREALEAARRCGNEAIEARMLGLLAAANVEKVDAATTTQMVEASLELARRSGNDSVLAYALHGAAYSYGFLGNVEAAGKFQLEQIELDRKLGNRVAEGNGLNNLCSGYLSLGLYKQARATIERGYALAETLGARRPKGYALLNLGEIAFATGDLGKARQLVEQSIEVFGPTEDTRGSGFAQDTLGFILLEMGDAPGARRRFEASRSLAADMGQTSMGCESAAGLAACAVQRGELEEARKYVTEAWNYLKAQGWKGLDTPGRIFLMCVETFSALGDEEDAGEVLDAVHSDLMRIAGMLTDPVWRQSFLENVPAHRTLMRMWERRKR